MRQQIRDLCSSFINNRRSCLYHKHRWLEVHCVHIRFGRPQPNFKR